MIRHAADALEQSTQLALQRRLTVRQVFERWATTARVIGANLEGKLRTANVLLADLKQMFRFAAEREIIEHSPIKLIQKRRSAARTSSATGSCPKMNWQRWSPNCPGVALKAA